MNKNSSENHTKSDLVVTPYELDNHLPYRLAVLSNILQLGRDIEIRSLTSLASRELRVLLNIGTFMPVSSAHIAYQTKLDSYTVSRGVKVLLQKKLIEKKSLENNKKEKLLYLTDSGIDLYNQLIKKLQVRDQQISQTMSENELRELTKTLRSLEQQTVKILAKLALSNEDLQKLPADQKEIIRWNNKD